MGSFLLVNLPQRSPLYWSPDKISCLVCINTTNKPPKIDRQKTNWIKALVLRWKRRKSCLDMVFASNLLFYWHHLTQMDGTPFGWWLRRSLIRIRFMTLMALICCYQKPLLLHPTHPLRRLLLLSSSQLKSINCIPLPLSRGHSTGESACKLLSSLGSLQSRAELK